MLRCNPRNESSEQSPTDRCKLVSLILEGAYFLSKRVVLLEENLYRVHDCHFTLSGEWPTHNFGCPIHRGLIAMGGVVQFPPIYRPSKSFSIRSRSILLARV